MATATQIRYSEEQGLFELLAKSLDKYFDGYEVYPPNVDKSHPNFNDFKPFLLYDKIKTFTLVYHNNPRFSVEVRMHIQSYNNKVYPFEILYEVSDQFIVERYSPNVEEVYKHTIKYIEKEILEHYKALKRNG